VTRLRTKLNTTYLVDDAVVAKVRTMSTNQAIDGGGDVTHVVVEADTSEGTHTVHLTPRALAQSLGFPDDETDLMGHMLHTATIEKIEAPALTGIDIKCGNKLCGGDAPTALHVTDNAINGFHALATGGTTTFKDGIDINISHNTDVGKLAEEIKPIIKRRIRWPNDIGKTSEKLMEGLEVHKGIVGTQSVKRVLVPTNGDHAVTRALRLNTQGHLSQYSDKSRQTIDVGGLPHVIMEHEHAVGICNTLEENLKIKSRVGVHGLSIVAKPLDAGSHGGKVMVTMGLKKHNVRDLLTEVPSNPNHRNPLTNAQAMALLEPSSGENNKPLETNVDVTHAVLGAKLSGPPKSGVFATESTVIGASNADTASLSSVIDGNISD